jgi:phospholipid/cholesterol/gamma-HCH transport system substrate-binding protein
MITRSQKIRLGLFLVSAFSILIVAVIAVTLERVLKAKDIYYIAYNDVSVGGLDIGSPVEYLGIKVGSIDAIEIDIRDINRVIVTVGLRKGTPIKDDVKAEISTIGITGLKLIELRGGSNEAALLPPGGFILPGKSLTENITGRAEDIAEKIELVLNNLLVLTAEENQVRLTTLVDQTTVTAREIEQVISDNKSRLNRTMINLDSLSAELNLASRSAGRSIRQIEAIVTSDTIKSTLSNISRLSTKMAEADVYHLIENLNATIIRTNALIEQVESVVNRNQLKLVQTVDDLHEAVDYLNNIAQRIDEDPSILIGGSTPDNPPDENLE